MGTTHEDGPRAKRRIAYLDGLRGVAIVSVIGTHWAEPRGWFPGGYIGVDIFFVISGYIITRILLGRDYTYTAFMAARARRLLPPLAGMIAAGLALVAVLPDAAVSLSTAARSGLISLLQLTSLAKGGSIDNVSPFGVTWSLSIEWYFYAVWPIAVLLIKRYALPQNRAARWLLTAAAVAYGLSCFLPGPAFYFGPTARIPELLIGCALALQSQATARAGVLLRRATWAGAFAVLVYVAAGPDGMSLVARTIGVPLALATTAGVIILAGKDSPAEDHQYPIVSALSWGPLVTVGRASYSIYLMHTIPFRVLPDDLFGASGVVVFATRAIGSCLLATACFYSLELPFIRSRQIRRTEPARRTEAIPQ